MEQRLQKIIAAHGLTSRRKAEQWLQEGRVQVNGITAQLGDSADEARDQITIDGIALTREPPKRYILLHKPRGYITTLSDDRGRRTVQELVAELPERVYPVGRLDQSSEGLLLMTNDGQLAQRMMHPSSEIPKTYLVWVTGYREDSLVRLAQPIVLDGRKIAKPGLHLIWQRGDNAQISVTIHEGRNRQVRRMCEAAGLHANRLKRIREGSLELGDLKPGQWRDLTMDELATLKK